MPSPIAITLHFPVELLHALSKESIASDQDIETIVVRTLESRFGPAPAPPVDYEATVSQAIERCKALSPGTIFSLNADHASSRRLFSREEWQNLVANTAFRPTVFGRQFSKKIHAEKLAEQKEKTVDNKQLYLRLPSP